MLDLRELYQELIIDHNNNPRNFRALPPPASKVEGHNPLCGDKITLYLRVEDAQVKDISFQGVGCAISQASASLMTEVLMGKTVSDAKALFQNFHELMTASNEEALPDCGKLQALVGVRAYPARVKCATLAWHTLEAALQKQQCVVSTE